MSLVTTLQQLLWQSKEFLVQLSPAQYALPLPVFSGASIGQHTRHFIEFLQCLITQLPSGTINYDARQRNTSLEQYPKNALQAIDALELQLNTLPQNHQLQLVVSYPQLGQPTLINTNLHRELAYNAEHIIHHLAIIKIGLLFLLPQIQLPPHFGVAYSTIQYHASGG
ncbi:hypothetical protein C7N43_23835 [Sphingobacteriales bacterium UPWRP_1]|nr:hypothetical protein BVG80_05910 [Sphingobacteriales bacterium TSM_CSM]PSJ74474.1 hypothetical protein C7N43_23835 [Sphingobacteriales bacterium UPWRP_1]